MYAVLAASSGLLFWLFVLGPTIEQQPVSRLAKVYYSTGIVLPVLGLVAAVSMPASANDLALASLGIPLLVAMGGLGHGVYVNGMLSRHEALERHCDRLREAIDATTKEPTAEDFMDDPSVVAGVAVTTSSRPEANRGARDVLERLRRRWREPGERPDDASTLTLVDWLDLPADLLTRLREATVADAVAKAEHAALQEELTAAGRELESVEQAMGSLRAEQTRAEQDRLDAVDDHRSEMLHLQAACARARLALTKGHNMSRFARQTR
jgi:hypothetical protein